MRHILLLCLAVVAASCGTRDKLLRLEVYNAGDRGLFPVASALVIGKKEVLLVDAQFEQSNAKRLVQKIRDTGKTLRTIYISHSDPDNYFGLETVKKAFPDAKVVATPQTVAEIRANMDSKLRFWRPTLKDEAPTTLILPDALDDNTLMLEGHVLKVIGWQGPDSDRTALWIPSIKTVVGSSLVDGGEHLWLAGTQNAQSRRNWLKALDQIEALKPTTVIPGHYAAGAPMTLESVHFTRDYIQAFDTEAARAENAEALIAAMKRRYPDLPGLDSLKKSAKVIKGEEKWPIPSFVGNRYEVHFAEDAVYLDDWLSENTMTYTVFAGRNKGHVETVQYTAELIRPNVYKIYWQEKDGTTVVRIDDFERMYSHVSITFPDGQFRNLQSPLKRVSE